MFAPLVQSQRMCRVHSAVLPSARAAQGWAVQLQLSLLLLRGDRQARTSCQKTEEKFGPNLEGGAGLEIFEAGWRTEQERGSLGQVKKSSCGKFNLIHFVFLSCNRCCSVADQR